jgi:endonuclease G
LIDIFRINKINHTMKFKITFPLIVLLAFVSACKKESLEIQHKEFTEHSFYIQAKIATNFPELFENGSKSSYTNGNVTLPSGVWAFNNAVIGTSSLDRKFGAKSARLQSTGRLTMLFNVQGATVVSFYHARYGSDASANWELWASTNNGSTWAKVGSTITASSTTMTLASFNVNYTGNVRFEIRKLTGNRLNIDEFKIEQAQDATSRDDNMALGNPSGSVTDVNLPNNYLLVKPQYCLSYNNSQGIPNWVSWHLSASWKGTAQRCNCFTTDNQLPSSFFRATTAMYTNSGFDRGHMCPSDDRDGSDADNAATFLMTNILPQAPNNNQQTWNDLEAYCRTLIFSGYELYIISGGYGQGGTGSLGGTTNTINNGTIRVPSNIWKVIVCLQAGTNDINRINTQTRVIAVDVPNNQTVNSQPWYNYRISVDQLESITGFDFMNNVPTEIQSVIESVTDGTAI